LQDVREPKRLDQHITDLYGGSLLPLRLGVLIERTIRRDPLEHLCELANLDQQSKDMQLGVLELLSVALDLEFADLGGELLNGVNFGHGVRASHGSREEATQMRAQHWNHHVEVDSVHASGEENLVVVLTIASTSSSG